MSISDEDMARLLQRAGRHDPAAFDRLYELYADRIYRYVWYRVRDADLAEDLTADIFVQMIQSLPTFQTRTSDTVAGFSGWLYRIAHNCLYHFYRRREREEKMQQTEERTKTTPADQPDLTDLAAAAHRRLTTANDHPHRAAAGHADTTIQPHTVFGGRGHTRAGRYSHADGVCDTNRHVIPHTDPASNSDADGHTAACRHTHPDRDGNGHVLADTEPHAGTDTNAKRDPDPHPGADGAAHRDGADRIGAT